MAVKAPARAIKLFGTTVADSKGRSLRAGPLSAVLDNGQLRYIRVNDTEVLRAIAFLVRDENWGTFTPEISNLKIKQGKTGFRVSYRARCADAKRALTYDAEITADAAEGLKFTATATPESDFLTNRTGFVVLHPLEAVAGKPVKVLHVDGSSEKSRFPKFINPVQPFYDIHALSHEVAPGNWAICRMEGDSFEMEDHRNWTDASFKTYVRPLAEPWPYTLPAGKSFDQAVTLTFTRKLPKPKARGGSKKIAVTLGRSAGTMPRIGVGVPAEEADNAIAAAEALRAVELQHLICQIDCRRGDASALCRRYKQLGVAAGADIVLEIILTGTESPDAELGRVGGQAKAAGLQPMAVAVSPAADLKATLPGSAGPKVPPLADIYKAARAAFPGARIGGGMFSYFTELNRKRPPVELLDYVTHTSAPIVHAADDISVMETLEALPYVIASTRAFIGKNTPYWVGPSSIAARDNPYGAATAGNADNGRVCLADRDPRHRGLFGAAWTLGYMAAFARGGVEAITMAAATGPRGLLHRPTDTPQPYFDDAGRGFYPLYHVIAGLAAAAGKKQLAADSAAPTKVASLAYRDSAGPALWLANLTGEVQTVQVKGFPPGPATIATIDEGTFAAATSRQDFLGKLIKKVKKAPGSIALRPYAVARIAAAT
jgi:D-apionolactonase